MFFKCSSLISLPDISEWDTSNVTDMSGMFGLCSSLISLPDISKWDTSNVNNMCVMFAFCSSLISLPDISKWDISNVTDMSGMFCGCSKLESFPNIFKWDTSKVIKMNYMFSNCLSLSYLPDISNWVTNNVNDMFGLLFNCNNLLSLPNISNWKINNNNNIGLMFYNLSSLSDIEDAVKNFNIDEEKKLNLYKLNQVNSIYMRENNYKLLSQTNMNFTMNIDNNIQNESKHIIEYFNYLQQISNYYNNKPINKDNNKINGYIIKYKIPKQKIIKIFCNSFVKNNKNKVKIIYKNKKFPLKDEMKIDYGQKILKLQMININDICNLSEMFKDCEYLLSFEEKENIDDNYLEGEMEKIFSNLIFLKKKRIIPQLIKI